MQAAGKSSMSAIDGIGAERKKVLRTAVHELCHIKNFPAQIVHLLSNSFSEPSQVDMGKYSGTTMDGKGKSEVLYNRHEQFAVCGCGRASVTMKKSSIRYRQADHDLFTVTPFGHGMVVTYY